MVHLVPNDPNNPKKNIEKKKPKALTVGEGDQIQWFFLEGFPKDMSKICPKCILAACVSSFSLSFSLLSTCLT